MAAPCVIELRANVFARGEHVPSSVDEIVADAIAAAGAGAAIVHWHASSDVAICRRLRRDTDLLLHPTLGAAREQDFAARERRVASLAGHADLVPVDFGCVNLDLWSRETGRFRTEDRTYVNARGDIRGLLEAVAANGLSVAAGCWSVGHVRTAARFAAMGLLDGALWQLVFTGNPLPDGMAPTRAGLEAMVEQVPSGRPWSVLCIGGDAFELAKWAIEGGGHVSMGLGDWPYRDLGAPTNTELVARVAALAKAAGRPAASPADCRAILEGRCTV
ncbi:MAG: 3-keto-5-aminohexanoate cleavage enzyme [Candidatus Binatota bacterium]|nr:3-keto-5-aminohexanoate cleavage enzyme [Candidatus Binatota bacterium]